MTAGQDHQRLVILDIDGTLLDTPHLAAWQQALERTAGHDAAALDWRQYQRLIAGRPRREGAAAALDLCGINPTASRVDELSAVKQELFSKLSVSANLFPDASRFLSQLVARSVPVAFCTASRNAGAMLHRLLERHAVMSCLIDRVRRSLGPDLVRAEPDRAAALDAVRTVWQVSASQCLVIDDAMHGVRAALNLGMGAIWLDRLGEAFGGGISEDPRRAGSLDEVALAHCHPEGLESV
jgi:beta-phosphoglucomutase